jgi:predicted N-formylglutamate amidohydrolase
MYHIAATKDGSSSSQIHGVDNLIEINIAFDNGTAALTQALENKLNSYLASANFSPVIL